MLLPGRVLVDGVLSRPVEDETGLLTPLLMPLIIGKLGLAVAREGRYWCWGFNHAA